MRDDGVRHFSLPVRGGVKNTFGLDDPRPYSPSQAQKLLVAVILALLGFCIVAFRSLIAPKVAARLYRDDL